MTPPEYQYLFDDLFQKITLYDDRAISADYVSQPDGKYQVHLTVEAKKFCADGRGQEHAVPVNDWIDVGVQDAAGKYLYLEKHKIDQEKSEVTIDGRQSSSAGGNRSRGQADRPQPRRQCDCGKEKVAKR